MLRLHSKSAEAIWVGHQFHRDGLMPGLEVAAVYRLQNAHAARLFISTRSHIWAHRMDKTRPAMEKLLWHGCSSLDKLEQIIGNGFESLTSHAARSHAEYG